MKNLRKNALFGLLLIAGNGISQMTIPDNYNNQTIPISSAAYNNTYINKVFIADDFVNLQAGSDAFSGMQKIASVTPNATGWPYYSYSTSRWPAGAWGRGYENGLSSDDEKLIANMDYEWYNIAGGVYNTNSADNYYYDSHPLIRDVSFFLQGHIHLQIAGNGNSTAANLQKIKDGIDYLLSEQLVNDDFWMKNSYQRNNKGGYKWWLKRNSQTDITSKSTNAFDDYETSHALAVLSEFYLSKIEYRRAEVLNAINLATNFLTTQVDWQGGNIALLQVNNNTRGLGLWALSLSYKITRDCSVFNKLLAMAQYVYSSQSLDGQWRTGGVDGGDMDNNTSTPNPYFTSTNPVQVSAPGVERAFHDQKIFYHFMALRGLVEFFSVLPDNHVDKRNVNEAINKGINHVINFRTYPAGPKQSRLKYFYQGESTDLNGNPIYGNSGICLWDVLSNGMEKYMETLVKLTYYAKNSIYYSTNDFNNLKNLTNKIASGMKSTGLDYIQPIGLYLDYMYAIDNNKTVLGWGSWGNSSTNYNADRINGKIVNGDFDNNGLEDDVAAFYDYGNNVFGAIGSKSTALQVWNGVNTSSLKYKGDNGMWFSRYFDATKIDNRVVSGDFNNDGRTNDIATIYDNGNGSASIWMFTSNGVSFTSATKWNGLINVNNIVGVVNGNFDNDAFKDDIAIVMTDGGNLTHIETFLYNGSSFVKNMSSSSPSFDALLIKGRIVSGDFDNDGKIDDIATLYDYSSTSCKAWIFKSNNAAIPMFTAASYWTSNSCNANQMTNKIASGDFDKDGYLDDIAVYYDYGNNLTKMWTFKSTGTAMSCLLSLTMPAFDATKKTNRVVSGNFDPIWVPKYNGYDYKVSEVMTMFNYYQSNDWENFSFNSVNSTFTQTYTNWNVQTNICATGTNKSMVSNESETTQLVIGDLSDQNGRGNLSDNLNLSKIYPNPFINEIVIDNLLTDNSIIKLYDMSGRIISTHEANDNRISINTSELIQGSYLISIEDKNGVIQKKMIVKQ